MIKMSTLKLNVFVFYNHETNVKFGAPLTIVMLFSISDIMFSTDYQLTGKTGYSKHSPK